MAGVFHRAKQGTPWKMGAWGWRMGRLLDDSLPSWLGIGNDQQFFELLINNFSFYLGLMYVSAQESKSLSSTSVSARACMARLK